MATQCLMFAELEPDATLDFPVPLSDKYKPERVADFAGLSEVKKVLAWFVARPTNAGFLFYGPAGSGKTSMAYALANELQGFVHHVRAGDCSVKTINDTVFSCWHCAPLGYKRHVVIVDEIDRSTEATQYSLLSYLDGTETVPDTVWVFTSNEIDQLPAKFTSRCRSMKFGNYGIQEDAAALLERVWKSESDKPVPNCARIIKDALGNVRAALMALEMKLYAA